GVAVANILLAAGVEDIVVCDRAGALVPGRSGMNEEKEALAARTNPRQVRGSADEALRGADVYIGVSTPGAISADGVRTMAPNAIVFAMANPTPEVSPEAIVDDVAVVATG